MKRLLFLTAITAILLMSLASTADARCATRADSLEAFAGCMVPMKGTIGTTTVYSSGKYDRDNRRLMSALMRSSVVPRQVMPPSFVQPFPYYYGLYTFPGAYMNLYFARNTSYRANWFRFASYYSPYYRYNPNVWLYAYYRH